ncbi:hypothetical protein [Desulfonatronum parangueonense]
MELKENVKMPDTSQPQIAHNPDFVYSENACNGRHSWPGDGPDSEGLPSPD